MTYIEEQILNRKTYYSFHNKPISQDKIDILLKNADGCTPALCDRYEYRVDVWPDNLKKELYEASCLSIITDMIHTKARNYFRNTGSWVGTHNHFDNVCINPQTLAPLIFSFSIPSDDVKGYSEEAVNYAIGFQVWHLVQLSHELGLDHAFLKGFDKDYLRKIIEARRFKGPNKYNYFPTFFLCIGYGDEVKDAEVQRPKPGKGILNTLRFGLKNE